MFFIRDKKTLEELGKIMEKSKLTEEEIEKHSRIVKEKVWKRHKKELGL